MVPHYTQAGQGQIAPISGDHTGLKRAEIKAGVREVLMCKDGEGKMGLRVCSVNKVWLTPHLSSQWLVHLVMFILEIEE